MNKYDYAGKKLWYQDVVIALLPCLADLLEESNIPYWLDWGTLLGAVRDGKMIPWDEDIDIGIFYKDIKKVTNLESQMVKDGFRLAMESDKSAVRVIRFYGEKGIKFHIDILPWKINGNIVKAGYNSKPFKVYPIEELLNLKKIEFEGRMYPCPREPEKSLDRLMGKDWRTPKVLSTNMLYIRQFDPENKDILEEVRKYRKY